MSTAISLRKQKTCPVCGKIKEKKTKFCSTRCGQIYIKRLKRKAKKEPELLTLYRINVELEKIRKKINHKLESLKKKIRYSVNKKIYWQIHGKRRGRWRKCRKCRKKFFVKREAKNSKKYCSRKCCIAARNRRNKLKRTKRERWLRHRTEKLRARYLKLWWYENCLWCGRVYYLEQAKDNAFCSRKCANLYWQNEDIIKKVLGEE